MQRDAFDSGLHSSHSFVLLSKRPPKEVIMMAPLAAAGKLALALALLAALAIEHYAAT